MKSNQKGFTAVELWICIWGVICVGLMVGAIGIGLHFIMKFW